MQKQKEAKSLIQCRTSARDYFSPRFCGIAESGKKSITNNRSNGGVALHGILPLATEIRLKSIDKQGVKRPDELHTPEQIALQIAKT